MAAKRHKTRKKEEAVNFVFASLARFCGNTFPSVALEAWLAGRSRHASGRIEAMPESPRKLDYVTPEPGSAPKADRFRFAVTCILWGVLILAAGWVLLLIVTFLRSLSSL